MLTKNGLVVFLRIRATPVEPDDESEFELESDLESEPQAAVVATSAAVTTKARTVFMRVRRVER